MLWSSPRSAWCEGCICLPPHRGSKNFTSVRRKRAVASLTSVVLRPKAMHARLQGFINSTRRGVSKVKLKKSLLQGGRSVHYLQCWYFWAVAENCCSKLAQSKYPQQNSVHFKFHSLSIDFSSPCGMGRSISLYIPPTPPMYLAVV